MLLSHLLHNEPGKDYRFNVLMVGVIMLGSSIFISLATYVYCNVMDSPHNQYLQVVLPYSASLPHFLHQYSWDGLCSHLCSLSRHCAYPHDNYVCAFVSLPSL